jgi:DNA-binding PadR family transcriptional regulator
MELPHGRLTRRDHEILATAIRLEAGGVAEWYGMELARALAHADGADGAVGAYRWALSGGLYRALGRLTAAGLLTSRPEDPAHAAQERRRTRRLYRLTALGVQTAASGAPGAQRDGMRE